jgi:hypothetical protein
VLVSWATCADRTRRVWLMGVLLGLAYDVVIGRRSHAACAQVMNFRIAGAL